MLYYIMEILVKPKNKIRLLTKKNKIKALVLEKLQEIPEINKLKSGNYVDQELVIFICNSIENIIKKDYGIDKKLFVCEIINEIFNLTEIEKNVLHESIQFIFDNGLIRKIPTSKKTGKIIWNYIKRKVG